MLTDKNIIKLNQFLQDLDIDFTNDKEMAIIEEKFALLTEQINLSSEYAEKVQVIQEKLKEVSSNE